MKRLYLIRHATAEHWSQRGDHGRALTEEGVRLARAAGEALATAGIEVIICSSATRAVQTAEALGLDVPILVSADLYNCDPQTILDHLAELDEGVGVAAVVAHSPGIPALAHALADGGSDPEAMQRIAHHFPVATLAGLWFDEPWESLRQASLFVSRLG